MSRWIFRNETGLWRVHHWWTHVQVHFHISHIVPGKTWNIWIRILSISSGPSTEHAFKSFSCFFKGLKVVYTQLITYLQVFFNCSHWIWKSFPWTVPYMPQLSPYVWTRCPHGWSLWRLARERSAHTLTGWRTARGHTWNTHKSLRSNGWEMMVTRSTTWRSHYFNGTASCNGLANFSNLKLWSNISFS